MKQYKYTINGTQYDVTINSIQGQQAKVEVNGIPFVVEMHGSSLVEDDLPVVAATDAAAPAPAAAPAAPVVTGAGEPVTAPMPGTILKVNVTQGQAVKAGTVLCSLEAMKMENEIMTSKDGTVTQVLVSKGSAVDTGAPLVVIG